ncbi:MAG TPA: hypothetical protein VGP93_06905 [Polyangiaceae bacterium]|nr:hypothetical protein [Polyangiaceae bacterium]
MGKPSVLISALAALGALLTVTAPAFATEHRFAFTYESGVLEPGAAEIEPWTTFRIGREHFYNRIDNRLEFELGLTERLQTSLYWNFSAHAADVESPSGPIVREREFELEGVSSEWKYKLSDPVADALGSALYLEGTLGPGEAEIEGKLILDKQVGRWLFASNLVFEHEWNFEAPGTPEREIGLELPLGATYFVTPSFTAGLEIRPAAEIKGGELETVAVYAGPTISTAYDRWWLAFSVLPQVFSPKNEESETFDLEDNERVRVRLLLGFHL